VLIDGGFGINIITENLRVQLGLPKPNPTPYNLHMAYQTIAKPLGHIRDLKIFVHGIPYTVTFTIINSSVLDSNYSMLLGHPWLKDTKVSHDWGTNIFTIHGTCKVRTIPITKKLGAQTKRPKNVVCYDFHYGISNEEEDLMFATKLDLFSIGTIEVSIHIELISKPIHIIDLSIVKSVPKELVELVCVLVVNLVTLPDIVK
jgi:hypothetical protein